MVEASPIRLVDIVEGADHEGNQMEIYVVTDENGTHVADVVPPPERRFLGIMGKIMLDRNIERGHDRTAKAFLKRGYKRVTIYRRVEGTQNIEVVVSKGGQEIEKGLTFPATHPTLQLLEGKALCDIPDIQERSDHHQGADDPSAQSEHPGQVAIPYSIETDIPGRETVSGVIVLGYDPKDPGDIQIRDGSLDPQREYEVLITAATITGQRIEQQLNQKYQELQRRHWEEEARLDMLTGLGNRRRFIEEVCEDSGKHDVYTLAFLDADKFKDVNDTLGHNVGDQVLRRIATELNRVPGAMPYRLSGDEFVIYFPGQTPEQAKAALEQAHDRLKRTRTVRTNGTVHELPNFIGMSVGIKGYSGKVYEGDIEGILDGVDALMYKAKEGGRGRIYCDGEQMVNGRLRDRILPTASKILRRAASVVDNLYARIA